MSPWQITFGQDTPVTVTGVAEGNVTMSLSQGSHTSGGSFNLAPATFTVDSRTDANGNGWNNGDVTLSVWNSVKGGSTVRCSA